MKPEGTHPLLIVFALWLLVFSASSQIMIIAPILPLIGTELGIAEAALGTLVSAYSLMVGLFAVISGPISDRIGRRRILLLGSGIMTLALLLHGFVVGYLSFIAVRVFAGIAGGVLSGSAVSYIGDYFPYARRGWATGWVMSGAAFGQIFGIPLGVVLAGSFGFRVPFYLFAVTMAMTFALVWAKVPQPDVRRSAGLTFGGAVANYRAMLRRREVAAAAFAFFLMFLGVSLYVVYLPTWLERSMGATTTEIAALFLVGGIAHVIVGPQAGKLSDRIGRKGIILLSCIGLSIVMSATVPVIRAVWIAFPFFFVVMALVAMRISPFSALLTALVSDERRGSLMSLTIALGQVGFAVGGAAAGLFYAGYGYASNTVLGAISVLLMGLIVWFLVPEPGRQEGAPPDEAEEVDRGLVTS
jgi:predicted MFS family arabinose efflux permease